MNRQSLGFYTVLWNLRNAAECCGMLRNAAECCGMLRNATAAECCGMLRNATECSTMLWNIADGNKFIINLVIYFKFTNNKKSTTLFQSTQ